MGHTATWTGPRQWISARAARRRTVRATGPRERSDTSTVTVLQGNFTMVPREHDETSLRYRVEDKQTARAMHHKKAARSMLGPCTAVLGRRDKCIRPAYRALRLQFGRWYGPA